MDAEAEDAFVGGVEGSAILGLLRAAAEEELELGFWSGGASLDSIPTVGGVVIAMSAESTVGLKSWVC